MNLVDILKRGERFAADNSPLLLTIVGVAGTISTAVLTGKAAVLADRRLTDAAESGYYVEPLTNRQKLDVVWKTYIPAATVGTITVICIIGANRIGTRRAAALATAYSLSEHVSAQYQNKVVELLGRDEDIKIREAVARDQMKGNPPPSEDKLVIMETTDVLCYDTITGRYFMSSVEKIRKAQNDINEKIINEMSASLYDFFEALKIPGTPYAQEVGWNSDSLLEVQFGSTMSQDDRPAVSIMYRALPVRNYFGLHP